MSNKKGSNSGCFSTILRRILCSGSLQTHPSDHIVDSNTTNEFVSGQAKVQVQTTSESGPGIVARLMGLDSLPNNNWVENGKTFGHVTRSRSVNFMDYMLEYDLTQAKHRRVKTSASFREVPQYLLQNQNQNHEFLVVYLDKDKEIAGFKSKKSEKGEGSRSKHNKQKENVSVRAKVVCKKQSQEKNKKISKLKNEKRRVGRTRSCINGGNDVKIKHGTNSKTKTPSVLTTRKKKNQVEYYSDNSSEDSSPVSVLSLNDFDADISEKYSRCLELNFEEKCSSISEGQGILPKNSFESTNIEELVGKPCKLTEDDIKFSNWIERKKVFLYEDFGEICFEFGEQILDLMLYQVADELVGINSDANYRY